MDPYHGVARALFETLPPGSETQPTIEEWDAAAKAAAAAVRINLE